MAQIALISIYLPAILSLMPFPLIVPQHENKFSSDEKKFSIGMKINFHAEKKVETFLYK